MSGPSWSRTARSLLIPRRSSRASSLCRSAVIANRDNLRAILKSIAFANAVHRPSASLARGTARRASLLALIAFAAAGCASAGSPPSSAPSPSAIAVPLVDAQRFLAANGASFEPQDAPTSVATTADAAIAIVRGQVTGAPTQTTAVFGRLLGPRLGVRSDRLAWLVTIDGVAPPRWNFSGPAYVGPLRTVAFVDAEDGRIMAMIATGEGP